jgi:predicted secreted protein
MAIRSLIAIYFLFFFLCLFVVLPFGVRTAEEEGIEKVPGQADSAPAHFRFWRTAFKTGLLALAATILFQQNYVHGWLTRDSFEGILQALGAPRLQ